MTIKKLKQISFVNLIFLINIFSLLEFIATRYKSIYKGIYMIITHYFKKKLSSSTYFFFKIINSDITQNLKMSSRNRYYIKDWYKMMELIF